MLGKALPKERNFGMQGGEGTAGEQEGRAASLRVPRGHRSAPHALIDPSKPLPRREYYYNWNNKGADPARRLRLESGVVGAGIGMWVSPDRAAATKPARIVLGVVSPLPGWDTADVFGLLAKAEQMCPGSVAAHPLPEQLPGSSRFCPGHGPTSVQVEAGREGGRQAQNPGFVPQTDHGQLQTQR